MSESNNRRILLVCAPTLVDPDDLEQLQQMMVQVLMGQLNCIVTNYPITIQEIELHTPDTVTLAVHAEGEMSFEEMDDGIPEA